MVAFLGVLLMLTWLAGICLLGFLAVDVERQRSVVERVLYGVGAAVLFALPFGLFSEASDPYANTLCVSGHQQWERSYRGPIYVGKTFIPGGEDERKVWVCDQWEAR